MADDTLSLHQMQECVHAWISQWEEGYWSPLANLARLTEEVGELAREINHHHGEKPKKRGEEATDAEVAVAEELADVLFVVVTLANSLDIDLSQAFRQVMAKYEIRDRSRFTPRSS